MLLSIQDKTVGGDATYDMVLVMDVVTLECAGRNKLREGRLEIWVQLQGNNVLPSMVRH